MNATPPSSEAAPHIQPWLNPWRDGGAMCGLVGVCLTAAMLGISPGLGVWFGWPFAIMGITGLCRHLSRNCPPAPGLAAKFYWANGLAAMAGGAWAAGAAALAYQSRMEGELTLSLSAIMASIAEPMALSICTGFLVVAATATAHRLSERACVPLALYWLSFVPFTILLFHLLLAGFELTGFS